MTSEVVLMNKHAVAMAADSAVTVTYWNQGKQESRFFKGANKIFNLSPPRPVGLMTFAAANINGVPWEIAVKAFRSSTEDRAHPHLEGYATALFEYLQSNTILFPLSLQEMQFKSQITNGLYRGWISCTYQHPDVVPEDKWLSNWEKYSKEISGSEHLGNLTEEDEKSALL